MISNQQLIFKELEKRSNLAQSQQRREINQIKYIKTTEKINKTKSWLCKKINKIDKSLGRLTKRKTS